MLATVEAEMGAVPIEDVSIAMVAQFLNRWPPNTSNKYRARLVTLFKWAIAQGLCDKNPAASTMTRLETVERQRLTLKAFQALRMKAETEQLHWFVNALDLALHTLQRREDVANMRFDDIIQQGKETYLLVNQVRPPPAATFITPDCAEKS